MWAIFKAFLTLGLTSFGGQVAHIGYMRDAFVVRKAWFSEVQFAQWIALCHALPGPSSSQLGFLIGYQRAGWAGAFAAFVGFTLPSMLIMVALAYGWVAYNQAWSSLIQALLIVAAAVVTQAVWSMAKQFCNRGLLILIALISATLLLIWPFVWMPIALIIALALLGQFMPTPPPTETVKLNRLPHPTLALGLVLLPMVLLLLLPVLVHFWPELTLFDSVYRAGALVFGGGHVVLPYLNIELVQPGLLSEEAFMSGYALAQTLPGPLFSFATYLGALMHGWIGALLATLAIFLAGLMWIIGVLPFSHRLLNHPRFQPGLVAIQAGVVGFLLAALINPILPHALINWQSVLLLALSLALLFVYRLAVIGLIVLNIIAYSALRHLAF
ncbi:MAG: chromate efflux transporter [Thiomicrospira sp.]|jgi:chromate transporter|nr:chromate efflux transporter [Thiomicrospira sp.]